jgi:2-polyprenyl-3-methyl-5-hydroxy-6-metoxy-1,4-benzoquinol methylase
MNKNTWEQFYKNTPLQNISWQKVQDDFLTEIINSGKVDTGSALDLGCGTGMKSIFLAKTGFDVTGVDISETAIKYANENSKKEAIKINFIASDATDLSFLGDEKFDLILDWANLHGILVQKREQYIAEIASHAKPGSNLILRCFGRKDDEEQFVDNPAGIIALLTKQEIDHLYGKYYEILEQNISQAPDNAPGKFFFELLMKRM